MSYPTQSSIPEQYKIKYADAWAAVVQQENERFAGCGMLRSDWVEKQYVDTDLEKTEWTENNARFGETNAGEVTGGNRSGFKRKADVAKKFDQWDEKFLSAIGLPQGETIQNFKRGWNRMKDQFFIDAATGDALGGPHPHTTTVAFPTANIVAVDYVASGGAANSGLTINKLLQVKRLANDADIDLDQEKLYLALSGKEIQDLQVYASTNFSDFYAQVVGKWLQDQKSTLLGFTPIITNKLPLSATTDYRTCVAFTDRAMCVAPVDYRTHIDILPKDRHALQIAHYGMWGVYRKKDELCWQIICDNSP